MTSTVARFQEVLTDVRLPFALERPDLIPSEALERRAGRASVPLPDLNEGPVHTMSARVALDRETVEPLHGALQTLPRAWLTDIRLWQWLSVVRYPRFVWVRWNGEVPGEPGEALGRKSLRERFLGGPTLRGMSRNALSRIFWAGDLLYSAEQGYDLARKCLGHQDLFQAVFERELGLYPPAARAFVRMFADSQKREWRTAIRTLNHYLTTVVLESLTEDEIVELLDRS